VDIVTLRNASLHADVLPGVGGALARFDWIRHGDARAVFRPCPIPPVSPSQVACFAMLPWANRLSPDKFGLAPNRAGEPCPIHGEGWQSAWEIQFQSATEVRLALDRSHGAPFSYRAELHYSLAEATLQVTLQVRNTGRTAMPFGVGLHPWFERNGDVQLQAAAGNTWQRDELGLPAEAMPLPEGWRFASAQSLPLDAVDHIFGGWDGAARIRLPQQGIDVAIAANMDYYILYAPAGAGFFCFEPVDHMINAHDQLIEPGDRLRRHVLFTVADM